MMTVNNVINQPCPAWWRGGDFLAQITLDCPIHTTLGIVYRKNDQRYGWRIKTVRDFFKREPPVRTEGVCATEREAMDVIEKYWLDVSAANGVSP